MGSSAREYRAAVLGLVTLALYAAVVLSSGKVDAAALADLFSTYLVSALSLTALYGLLFALGLHLRERRSPRAGDAGPTPVATLTRVLQARWGRDRLASLLWPPVMFAGLMSSFNAFKQQVLIDAGFHIDAQLTAIDKALFFGTDPWRVTHALFSEPWMTLLFDRAYHLWFVPMSFGVIICAIASHKSYRLRTQYILSYMTIWIGIGSILAWLLPSAGPCFYNDYVGPQASFAELGRQLDAVRALYGPDALASHMAQAHLRFAFGNPELIVGGGISAMPSVHNGLSALFAVAGFSINRKLGWALSSYALVIWIGSIHLGWHYAVDGLVSIALTVVIWKVMGALADRLERPIFASRNRGFSPAAA
jgi:hypothetical protein